MITNRPPPTILNLVAATTCFFLLLSGRLVISGFQTYVFWTLDASRTSSTRDTATLQQLHLAKKNKVVTDPEETNRRRLLSKVVAVPLFSLISFVDPKPADAASSDEIFRSNPLTNPVLEQIRIWEQAEADELRYGGELERGDAGNRGKTDAYPRLLVPVLNIADELQTIDRFVHNSEQWNDVQQILRQPQYQEIGFKKIFNAFGDNIYYSDPDRANVYLGGGATPSAEQSMAYLLRNEILTNIEYLQAEVNYLIQHPDEPADDLYAYSSGANTAMQKYLAVVPPEQLRLAKEIIASS